MNLMHSAGLIAVIAAATALLRFLPFLIFSGKRKTPGVITYLEKVLPSAVMGMLVIYCLRGVSLMEFPFGLPELIAGTVVVLLHLWRRNTLLSILTGTILYMLLTQFVFL